MYIRQSAYLRHATLKSSYSIVSRYRRDFPTLAYRVTVFPTSVSFFNQSTTELYTSSRYANPNC